MPLHRLLPDLANAGLLRMVQWPAEPASPNMDAIGLHVRVARAHDEHTNPFVRTPPGGQEARLAIEVRWKIKVVR